MSGKSAPFSSVRQFLLFLVLSTPRKTLIGKMLPKPLLKAKRVRFHRDDAQGQEPDPAFVGAALVVFMAAVLPRPLGHPYPAFIEPYIVFGGILIYVIGGLGIVAFVRKSQGRSAK